MNMVNFIGLVFYTIFMAYAVYLCFLKQKLSASSVEKTDYVFFKIYEFLKICISVMIKAFAWLIKVIGEEIGLVNNYRENQTPIINGSKAEINEAFHSILSDVLTDPYLMYIKNLGNVVCYEIRYIVSDSMINEHDVIKKITHKVCAFLSNAYGVDYEFMRDNIRVRNIKELNKVEIYIPHNDTGCIELKKIKVDIVEHNSTFEERWNEYDQ